MGEPDRGTPPVRRSLAHNGILGAVTIFTLPCVLSCFLRVLCNVTSLCVVKRFDNTTNVATINGNTRALCVVAIALINLTVKAAIVINRTINSHHFSHTRATVNGAVALFVNISIILTTVLLTLYPRVITLVNAPTRTIRKATTCLHVYFVNVPFVTTCGVLSTVFHKLNSSHSPVCIVNITYVVGVTLSFLFVNRVKLNPMNTTLNAIATRAIDITLTLI